MASDCQLRLEQEPSAILSFEVKIKVKDFKYAHSIGRLQGSDQFIEFVAIQLQLNKPSLTTSLQVKLDIQQRLPYVGHTVI